MDLKILNQRIQEKLSLSHKDIIILAYQHMLKKHNTNCGCDYCNKLREYRFSKILLHRYKNFGDYFDRSYLSYLDYYSSLVKAMKAEKDQLKLI